MIPVRPSVCLKLKISVTAEPIGIYFSVKIPTPVVVLSYFPGGLDHLTGWKIEGKIVYLDICMLQVFQEYYQQTLD